MKFAFKSYLANTSNLSTMYELFQNSYLLVGMIFKTVSSSGYILILLSIVNILASLIETCLGWSRMRNVN